MSAEATSHLAAALIASAQWIASAAADLPSERTDLTAARHSAAKVAFLSNPASYADHPSRVDTIETHFAWIFLAGARAYKLKKPTHLRGADWRTATAREHACREELRLNRQLSAPTYLEVEPLIETPAGFRIGGEGRAVDWLVVMRRLDERRMLKSVLTTQALTRSDLDAVLEFLVQFYRSRSPLPFTPETYLRRLTARMEEALSALQRKDVGLPANEIDPVASGLRTTFLFLRSQLTERATRHIVEAHGDLRAEHIYLGPPVQIIDALEVYADLRMLDTAEEVAMLALECERPATHWAPAYLRARYRRLAADTCSDELFEFYTALRAITQAKLAIWHLDDPQQCPDPLPWRERALAAATTALRHCGAAMPRTGEGEVAQG
jgi:aminoglycoside phosphotransferase family enzyme